MIYFRERGFTLFEILIVMVIIGVVAAGATLTISHNREWEQKALVEEVTELLSFAQEYALLQTAALKITVTDQQIQFNKWMIDDKNRGRWVHIHDQFLHDFTVSKEFFLHLQLTTNDDKEAEKNHDILVSVSGDWTPFSLWIGRISKAPGYQIQGLRGGELKVQSISE